MLQTEEKEYESEDIEYNGSELNENDDGNKSECGESDEDEFERFELEIEDNVALFVDEDVVGYNVYSDSEDSSEEDIVVKKRDQNHIQRGDGKLELGQLFYTGLEFKEVVLVYILRERANVEQYRCDKTKIGMKCDMNGDCPWRLYCSYDKPKNKWEIKIYFGEHTCIRNGKYKMLKVPVIARLFMEKLRQNPDLMPKTIQEMIKNQWKLIVTVTLVDVFKFNHIYARESTSSALTIVLNSLDTSLNLILWILSSLLSSSSPSQ